VNSLQRPTYDNSCPTVYTRLSDSGIREKCMTVKSTLIRAPMFYDPVVVAPKNIFLVK
jgi:hypothetical protein